MRSPLYALGLDYTKDMAKFSILVTGGAGFIGSNLSRELLRLGHAVRILDNLDPQVHRLKATQPPEGADMVRGDVRDPDTWSKGLQDVEVVYHLAAAVGVAQSMYQIKKYVEVNALGTANLLDHIANCEHDVGKLVVASSNTVYGEGAYSCPSCGIVYPGLRQESLLRRGLWEPRCPKCGLELSSIPTPEDKPLAPTTVYAITKRDQEEMCLHVGRAYGIPTVALRYFCVYGPGQSLSNPYTGVAAIFSSRVKAGKPPIVYEDGRQTRDFVNVRDVVQANVLAMKRRSMRDDCFNVGTGIPSSIIQVAQTVINVRKSDLEPLVTGRYRSGDIRHCYADIRKIRAQGFQPEVRFEEGMREFVEWAISQPSMDGFDQAAGELESRGLVSGGRRRG